MAFKRHTKASFNFNTFKETKVTIAFNNFNYMFNNLAIPKFNLDQHNILIILVRLSLNFSIKKNYIFH